jgi:hypothetical protein
MRNFLDLKATDHQNLILRSSVKTSVSDSLWQSGRLRFWEEEQNITAVGSAVSLA